MNQTKKSARKPVPNQGPQAVVVRPKSIKHIICPDTSVLIQDPECLSYLLRGGNLVVILWQVFFELDNLKRSDVGWEAQKVIRKIHSLLQAGANLVLERRTFFSGLGLDKNTPDHKIIAGAAFVARNKNNPQSRYYGYDKIKLVTNDYGMQIIAMEVIKRPDFSVEFYKRDITKLKDNSLKLESRNIPSQEIKRGDNSDEYFPLSSKDKLSYSKPVIVYSDVNGDWQAHRVAYRRDNRLLLINPNISVSGIRPKNNGGPNWQQIAALQLLTDDSVSCVFLQGGAGTGKTLLALAAGLHQKRQKKFNQLIIVRPTVYLSDDDNLGFLPGDVNQKMAPWLLSIKQNLGVIKPLKKNEIKDEDPDSDLSAIQKAGIEVQPLGFIRGSSFENCYIIVEEAQNLPRHTIKTILTRPAKGTKIVFTGDLSQIDNRRLNRESSGLTYAIAKMNNNPLIGIVNFEQTLRSPLASLAEKIL